MQLVEGEEKESAFLRQTKHEAGFPNQKRKTEKRIKKFNEKSFNGREGSGDSGLVMLTASEEVEVDGGVEARDADELVFGRHDRLLNPRERVARPGGGWQRGPRQHARRVVDVVVGLPFRQNPERKRQPTKDPERSQQRRDERTGGRHGAPLPQHPSRTGPAHRIASHSPYNQSITPHPAQKHLRQHLPKRMRPVTRPSPQAWPRSRFEAVRYSGTAITSACPARCHPGPLGER